MLKRIIYRYPNKEVLDNVVIIFKIKDNEYVIKYCLDDRLIAGKYELMY